MNKICVVYLVRASNDIESFKTFLASYRQNRSGIDHDFLMLFKGFDLPDAKVEYLALLEPFQYLSFDVPDVGFDITAYFSVFRQFRDKYQYFCFLNSHSTILCQDWLRKLHDHISLPEVGLVGATGSWQSLNPWGHLFRRIRLRPDPKPELRPPNLWARMSSKLDVFRRLFFLPIFFSKFPNFHIRTNAFMIKTELMIKIEHPTIKTKFDAYRFESGKNGLTRQVIAIGKKVLVVGDDAVGYGMNFWNKSKTYWQSQQENLLVADNQTRPYQDGSTNHRRYLSVMAWGENVR